MKSLKNFWNFEKDLAINKEYIQLYVWILSCTHFNNIFPIFSSWILFLTSGDILTI